MSEHKIEKLYTGKGEMRTITPLCSCGWTGKAISDWDDYQYAKIQNQISDHYIAANSENPDTLK